tara:strand:+ start:3678 stop:3914 length:237 start_codon:yes stop_codon:yes gene_type:complete
MSNHTKHKRVKLKQRPVNTEREVKYKDTIAKIQKLENKQDQRILDGKKRSKIIDLRLKMLKKKREKGRKGSRLDGSWG